MKKIILAGNGVASAILLGYLRDDSRYKVVASVCDDIYVSSNACPDLKCVGISASSDTFARSDHAVIMAAGYSDLNRTRESLFVRLKSLGYHIETYVHPDARVYTQHALGEGCVVLPGAVIEPHAQVASNTMVWCNATLAHHSVVAENCWIASGAVVSGQTLVGRNTFVGVNATIVNDVKVAEYNLIGAGALISKCTKPNTVHLARSAEMLRYNAEEYDEHFGI
jgi:sugar O-acyltransferase (sialic acid O-acetyltransferase NeuD family)